MYIFNHRSILNRNHTICGSRDFVIVGDEKYSYTIFNTNLMQQRNNLSAVCFIQSPSSLIAKQHTRLLDQSSGNGYPLLLASRQFAWILVQNTRYIQHLRQFLHRIRSTRCRRTNPDVLFCREMGEQQILLENLTDILSAKISKLMFAELCNVFVSEEYSSAARLCNPDMMLSKVDFPDPLGPMITVKLPSSISSETSLRMSSLFLYCFVTSLTVRIVFIRGMASEQIILKPLELLLQKFICKING